ncbi:sensor histidine kinase [Sporosarcina limicola]|uniref:histidine kinase n=1 Tax=Sporosarcina limicola TaxID=34101 RepID=A0A927R1X4_9BACL|nr:HAMP domain-containing sensor histidine kinase [Sporosarcina limicola]MBE1553261.1 signal transduction histidine kinase [Sporosarcina limicola]
MNLSRKMTIRFVTYFFMFYAVLIVVSFGILMGAFTMTFSSFEEDIREAVSSDLEKGISRTAIGKYSMSNDLIELAERSGGIVRLIAGDGRVVATSGKGEIHPDIYTFSDFSKLQNDKGNYLWQFENGVFLLFTEYTKADALLETLQRERDFPLLSTEGTEYVKVADAVFERYDALGNRIEVVNGSSKEALRGTDLLSASNLLTEQKEIIATVLLSDGSTAVVRMENPYFFSFDSKMITILKKMGLAFLIFHVFLLLFTLIYSLWIGTRLGRPVLYFLKRIEQLARKDYSQLKDTKLRVNSDGRLKRKYRIYEDIDRSLFMLSMNLADNERKLQLTEKLREEWITGLSHDLKTPLSSVYGYAVMLSSDHSWTGDEVRDFACTMRDKADYMDALIDDLTYTYQLKNDGVLLEKERVELGEYIVGYAKRYIAEDIRLSEMEGSIYVFIDPIRFSRVLDNVIGNAVKHNPDHTPIHIAISAKDDSVLLEVRDEGEGMTADIVENLFNRYYRGTNTTSDESGTGLGLTIARQLVEAHDGEIDVESSGQGTTIRIKIPKL